MIVDTTQIEQQEYRTVKRLAAHYGEASERITGVGESYHSDQLRVLCLECGKRLANGDFFVETRQPSWLSTQVKSVELKPVYRVIDNVYRRVGTILAGQCQDCGHVYYAKFWVEITKNDT